MLRRMSKVLTRGWVQDYISGVGLPVNARHLQANKIPFVPINRQLIQSHIAKGISFDAAGQQLFLFDDRLLFIHHTTLGKFRYGQVDLTLYDDICQAEPGWHPSISIESIVQNQRQLAALLPKISIRQFYRDLPYRSRCDFDVNTQTDQPISTLVKNYIVGIEDD